MSDQNARASAEAAFALIAHVRTLSNSGSVTASGPFTGASISQSTTVTRQNWFPPAATVFWLLIWAMGSALVLVRPRRRITSSSSE